MALLSSPIWDAAPMPFVSEVEPDGFSAEFRTHNVELHVEVDDDGDASVYVYQHGGTEWEGPLADVPDGIEKWAWRLGHSS